MEIRGSYERWEPKEIKLLVKKYYEHKGDFKIIKEK